MGEIELQDAILRHALELQRLSDHHADEAIEIIAELQAELETLLSRANLTEAGKREVNGLIKQAQDIISGRYAAVGDVVNTSELVVVVAQRTADAMADLGAKMPTAERLASLAKEVMIDGAPSNAWWERQAEDTAFKFAREVRAGVLEGASQEAIVARIFGKGDEIGFFDQTRRNVRTLVHSSVMTAANQARLETFRKNSRHVGGLRWLATLDSHTCLTCAALDGSTWDLDGKPTGETALDFQFPPAHFSCRCVISPMPKSLNSILGLTGLDERLEASATRASKDGPVKAATFGEFLARQDRAFVEDMLGAERAEMWRRGEITLTDLVTRSGKPLTLEEVRARP